MVCAATGKFAHVCKCEDLVLAFCPGQSGFTARLVGKPRGELCENRLSAGRVIAFLIREALNVVSGRAGCCGWCAA